MFRQRTVWFVIGLLVLASLACNAFAGAVEPGLALPPPPTTVEDAAPPPDGGQEVAGDMAPTATLVGEGEGEETAVPTGEATVMVLVDLNVRSGPGIQYDRVSFLLKGEELGVLGKDPATGWWKIECPARTDVTECWASGGAEYTAVTNAEGVPITAVPPTPTPIPPTPEPGAEAGAIVTGNGLLVYVNEIGLWTISLDLSASPPSPSDPTPIATSPNITGIDISPDGQKIAFRLQTAAANQLYVINIDGSDNRLLVDSTSLPIITEDDATNLALLIGDVQWLADSQTIVFNTNITNLIGPGFASQEDLWAITLDGSLIQLFAAGTGGGTFTISGNNQVIMGQTESIIRANLDGTNWETVLAFKFVNTASEAPFYPQVQWTADSSRVFVAIPNSEPFGADASATLWQIPGSGQAELLATVSTAIPLNSFFWSPNGDVLTYLFRDPNASGTSTSLMLADGAGQNPGPYTLNDNLAFFEWNQDATHFLYRGTGLYAVGRIGEPPLETVVEVGETAVNGRWLTNSTFVVAVGAGEVWNLISGNLSGAATPLVTVSSMGIHFDVWVP